MFKLSCTNKLKFTKLITKITNNILPFIISNINSQLHSSLKRIHMNTFKKHVHIELINIVNYNKAFV